MYTGDPRHVYGGGGTREKETGKEKTSKQNFFEMVVFAQAAELPN